MVTELLHMIKRCIWVEMRDSSELFRRVLFDLRISYKSEAGGSGESRGLCGNEYRNWNDVVTSQGMLAVCRSLKKPRVLLPWSLLEAALLPHWFQLCGAHLGLRILRANLCCSKPLSQGETVLFTTVASNLRPSHLNFLSYFICHFLRGFDVQC